MTFAQTHDTLWYSPKFGSLTFAARGLWVTCQSWCAGQLTDGLIPANAVKDVGGTDPQVRALVKSGLWEVTETRDGELAYQFHDWLDHNESADKISTRKRKENARSAARREAKNAPESRESSIRNVPGMGDSSTRTTFESTRNSTRNAPESEGLSPNRTPSDLYEPKNDRAVSKEKGTERNPKSRHLSVCLPARPEGESHTPETKTEAKDEAEERTKRSPNPSLPRNGMDILAARYSDSRKKEPVVDASDSEDQDSAPTGPDQSDWDKYERQIGRRLEHMTPRELVHYMESFHREVNGINQNAGPAGVATMKTFQEDYGVTHTAELIRHLFQEDGIHEISSMNYEPVSYIHFSEKLRWWVERTDGERQLNALFTLKTRVPTEPDPNIRARLRAYQDQP